MAAKGTTVATAYVQVMPSMEGATSNITSALLPQLGGLGDEAGGLFGKMFNGKAGALVSKLPGILAGLGIGKMIGDFIGDSINVGKEFDKAMSQVAATMGTTVDQIGELRSFAQEMGATTAFSATQAAEALNYMALAGYDAETSMKMLPNVLNLAASGNMELARASDMVTDAQSALGLSIEQTEVMVDQMAKTASTTNTSVSQLGDAFLTVGGTAKMMKGGTAELAQVLGILADNGVKGSEGGTALRNILLSLSAPTNEAADTMKELGVSVFDAEGNMRSMEDVMGDLNAAMADMTSEERTNAISSIFNKRDLKSVEALLGTNADRWHEVADAIGDAQGAAAAMAQTQLDNLAGDMTLLESATEGLQIQVSSLLVPALRAMAQFAGNAIGNAAAFFERHAASFQGFAQLLAGPIKVALAGLSVALDIVGAAFDAVFQFIDPFAQLLTNAFERITAAFQTTDSEVENDMSLWQMLADVFGFVGGIISTVLSPIINGLAWVIEGLAGPIKTVAGVFQDLWNRVTEIWDGIKTTISDAIEKIKSFFDFKLEFPHIELPHFGVSGNFSADPPSVPDFYVSYYAKGGIIDDPHLIVAGEAGPEAIVPLTAPNLAPFADAVAERVERAGDTYVFNITADSETTLQRLVREANQARRQYA